MNDEPSSAASAAAYHHHDIARDGAESVQPVATAKEVAERRKKNRENFNRRRVELLDDLLRNVDILVYAELSAIYYMDCSFVRFAVRAFVQLLFITPKPTIFPEPPSNRPYIGAIFGSNLLCIIAHVLMSAPSAGEETRGYLHGGMAMDFIGQKAPTSKLHLLLLDVLVVVLQVVQLSVHILRLKLKQSPPTSIAVTTTSGSQYSAAPVSRGQTVEDEERGVRRSVELERQGDIEMQNLLPSGPDADAGPVPDAESTDTSSRDALLASTAIPHHTDAHIFSAFNSGQIVITDIDIMKTIREQFWEYQKSPRDATSAEANRLMRERITRRMLRWRFDSPANDSGRTVT